MGEEPVLVILRRQLSQAIEVSRELTGHGFYLNFRLNPDVEQVDKMMNVKSDFCFGDVEATMSSLEHGAGFLLWVQGGKIASLEGYTYSENWPQNISDFHLRYLDGDGRNWSNLRDQWKISNGGDI
jgi:hypothetical protein